MGAHVPRRRCAGCGGVAPKPELIRLAIASAAGARTAVADRAGTMPGRGAYLCRDGTGEGPRAECVRLALRKGGVARALRAPVPIDPEIVESVSR